MFSEILNLFLIPKLGEKGRKSFQNLLRDNKYNNSNAKNNCNDDDDDTTTTTTNFINGCDYFGETFTFCPSSGTGNKIQNLKTSWKRKTISFPAPFISVITLSTPMLPNCTCCKFGVDKNGLRSFHFVMEDQKDSVQMKPRF